MAIASIITTVGTLLSVTEKLLEKSPRYHQKKKEKFERLKQEFQKIKVADNRDLNTLMNLRDEIQIFAETFIAEINSGKTN